MLRMPRGPCGYLAGFAGVGTMCLTGAGDPLLSRLECAAASSACVGSAGVCSGFAWHDREALRKYERFRPFRGNSSSRSRVPRARESAVFGVLRGGRTVSARYPGGAADPTCRRPVSPAAWPGRHGCGRIRSAGSPFP